MTAQLKAVLVASGLLMLIGLAGCGGSETPEEAAAARNSAADGTVPGGSGSMAPGASRESQ